MMQMIFRRDSSGRMPSRAADPLSRPHLPAASISTPTAVTFPTADGDHAHALFYPPCSTDSVGPAGELPPLVVRIHGGPTAAARAVSLGIARGQGGLSRAARRSRSSDDRA